MYAEPFAGSLAVLLANPRPKREVVCDKDGHICNFWRALRGDPELGGARRLATFHQDLTARHRWLREWAREHAHELSEDPDYYSAKAAGWWVWGISNWIGSGWCTEAKSQPDEGEEYTGGSETHIPIPSGRGVNQLRTQIKDVVDTCTADARRCYQRWRRAGRYPDNTCIGYSREAPGREGWRRASARTTV